MFVIDIIPLAILPQTQGSILSYFYATTLEKGAVVEILIGERKIKGVVLNCDPIATRRTQLRKDVDFKLKGINKVLNSKSQVSNLQFELAQKMSERYFSPLGVCLKTILPPFWEKKSFLFDHNLPHDREKKNNAQKLILCAEKTAMNYLAQKYKKDKPIIISSSTKNKDYLKIWNDVNNGSTSLIIGTRVALFLPYCNLKKIIVDDSTNEMYKSDMMPRYNGADFAKVVAKFYNSSIEFNSIFPSLGSQNDLLPTKNHYSDIHIIDMVKEIKDANYSIFSRFLKNELNKLFENKQNLLVYVPRRGHANYLLCQTCGHILSCPNCSSSLVIHESIGNKSAHRLLCHHCDFRQEMPKQCPSCKSYTLVSKGIGIEKVVSEIKKYFNYQNLPLLPVFQLDSDSTKNNDETEQKIINQFENHKPSILAATQIIFSHRRIIKKIPKIFVMNAETLIKIPDFQAEESLVRQLLALSTMTDNLYIQTYNKDNPTLNSLAENNVQKFIQNEIGNRKKFNYPPFSQLIKLTYRHKDNTRTQNEAKILYEKIKFVLSGPEAKSRLSDYITILPPFSGFISRERGQYIWNILLKVSLKLDIEQRNSILKYVTNGWQIDVD